MSSSEFLEHLTVVMLALTACWLVWLRYGERLHRLWKQARTAARKRRKWKAKTPTDCPACRSGVGLSIHPIRREVQPWCERKSRRGREEGIRTQGHACPNPSCPYFGVTDERVRALVGNGKQGKYGPIQALRCQACDCCFSSRRNTPLYHLKTHPERIEICLWLLAEGVDVSVLVRYTGHVDATLTRWLTRAGIHGEHLHTLWFVQLNLDCLQVDELRAPVAGCGWPSSR